MLRCATSSKSNTVSASAGVEGSPMGSADASAASAIDDGPKSAATPPSADTQGLPATNFRNARRLPGFLSSSIWLPSAFRPLCAVVVDQADRCRAVDGCPRAIAHLELQPERVLLEELGELLAAHGPHREQLVGFRIVLEQDRREWLRRGPRDDLRARSGIVDAAIGAAGDPVVAITDEAHLLGGVGHLVRADGRVRDDRFVRAHAAWPRVALARFRVQEDSRDERLRELQEKARRGRIGIVEDVGLSRRERSDAERLAALVDELHARVFVCAEGRGLARIGKGGARGGGGAELHEIAALHAPMITTFGGAERVPLRGWARTTLPKTFSKPRPRGCASLARSR